MDICKKCMHEITYAGYDLEPTEAMRRIKELEADIVGYNYANQILMDKIEKIVDVLVQGIKGEKIENSLAVEIGKIISSDETGTP